MLLVLALENELLLLKWYMLLSLLLSVLKLFPLLVVLDFSRRKGMLIQGGNILQVSYSYLSRIELIKFRYYAWILEMNQMVKSMVIMFVLTCSRALSRVVAT